MSDTSSDIDEVGPIIDLRYTHETYRRGDVLVILTWNQHTGKGCLVLLNGSRDINSEHMVPCIVNEEDAWKWSDQIGDRTHQAIWGARFAAALGFSPHVANLSRVIGIIQDHVGDLANIPPQPDWGMKHVADAFAVDQDGKEIHKEIYAHG